MKPKHLMSYAALLVVLGLSAIVASADEVGAVSPIGIALDRPDLVDDPFRYYVGTYPYSGLPSANPLAASTCTYSYVYSEGGVVDFDDTVLEITAWWQSTNVDWAFEIVFPNDAPCEIGYIHLTWDAQVEAPENPGDWAGIALICEVEQESATDPAPDPAIVPCPGTHVFSPFIARTDSAGAGQLIHSSFDATLRVPADVDGPPPPGPGSDPNPPVTLRIGFVQNFTDSAPYPANLRVVNQNLAIEVGPSSLEPPPPPALGGGE